MRLTTFIMLVSFIQLSAASYGQRVTLHEQHKPLKSLFKEIRKQTGYNFFYDGRVITDRLRGSIDVTDASLEEALDKLLEGLPFTHEVVDNTVVIKEAPRGKSPAVISSERSDGKSGGSGLILAFQESKGRVVDSVGNPLVGASIRVLNADGKRTALQTTTDRDGYFVLHNVPEDASLEISYVGYAQRVVKTAAELGSVVLNALESELEEVEVMVNSGFQRLPKERSTGSYDYIGKELLNQQVSTDVLSRLEAVANGLVYNRSTTSSASAENIQIRGVSTLLGGKGPLIVLDNFPYEGDLNNINPNDIEDITILKDAAASSIWGARAGNGVIVITTKKGQFNKPLAIEFNTNISSIAKPDFQYLDQVSTSDFIDVERFLFDNKFGFSDTSNRNRPPFTEVYEILFAQQRGQYTDDEADQLINRLKGYNYYDQLRSNVYRNGFNQQYALNVNGGSDRVGWIASAGYDRNISDLNSSYNRFNLRMANTYRPVKNLEIGSSIYLTQSGTVAGRDGYQDITAQKGKLPPYTRIVDEQGNALPVIKDYRPSYLDQLMEQSNGKLLDWNYYPLEDYKYRNSRSSIGSMLINTSIRYEILDGLSISGRYLFEDQRSQGQVFNNPDSYMVRNLINRFSVLENNGTVRYQLPYGSIADRSNGKMNSHQARAQVEYDKFIGEHAFSLLGGAEIRHTQHQTDNFRSYGLDEETWVGSNIDFVNTKPVLLPVGLSSLIPNTADLGKSTSRFVSTFANMGYTYRSRYTATFSARRDASNLFGVNTNQKWRPLWSAGLRYELSKEPFYRSELLPYMVARLTYGFSGNIHPTRSALTTISYGAINPYAQTPTATISQFANPELKWEKIGMLNAAIDFGFKNHRLNGSIEYYQKNADDLFGSTRIDYTTGINTGLIKNVAKMKGRGVDVSLNSQNLVSDFRWLTALNFSYNTDEITKYYLSSEQGAAYVKSPLLISSLEGKPAYAVFSYRWRGLDPNTGDPLGDINGRSSNNYTAIMGDSTRIEDLVYHGSYSPTIFGSLGNDFSWKGLTLSVRLMYKMGYYFRKSTINYSQLFDLRTGHADYVRRWQNPGDEVHTDVPSMPYPSTPNRDAFYEGSEVNVLRGDHIRIQYINLNYNFSKSACNLLGLRGAQVYLNMSNLGIIWRANKAGIDPEYLPASSTLPPLTTAFGCRVNF